MDCFIACGQLADCAAVAYDVSSADCYVLAMRGNIDNYRSSSLLSNNNSILYIREEFACGIDVCADCSNAYQSGHTNNGLFPLSVSMDFNLESYLVLFTGFCEMETNANQWLDKSLEGDDYARIDNVQVHTKFDQITDTYGAALWRRIRNRSTMLKYDSKFLTSLRHSNSNCDIVCDIKDIPKEIRKECKSRRGRCRMRKRGRKGGLRRKLKRVRNKVALPTIYIGGLRRKLKSGQHRIRHIPTLVSKSRQAEEHSHGKGVCHRNIITVKLVPSWKESDSIHVGLLNACSVANKAIDLSEYITENELDVASFTETWLREGDDSAILDLCPPGY
ncbi:hypothetical protein CAPTEDRAFT_186876, partial [Capitella teleta]